MVFEVPLLSTPLQIAASRANGAKSKGPVTVQGKFNSARNRLRHALLARTIVLEDEAKERFRELLDALMEEYHPATTTQVMLIETMAIARWRLLRIWTLQKISLEREMAMQDPSLGPPEVLATLAFAKSAHTPEPELLLRYETTYDRQFTRALKALRALQSDPTPQPPQPYEPASLPGHTFQEPHREPNPLPELPAGSEQAQPEQTQPEQTGPPAATACMEEAGAQPEFPERTREATDSIHPPASAALAGPSATPPHPPPESRSVARSRLIDTDMNCM